MKLTELPTPEYAKHLSIVHSVILLIPSRKDVLQTVLQPKQHMLTMTHRNARSNVLLIFLLIIQHTHVFLFAPQILLTLVTNENAKQPVLKTGMLILLQDFVLSQLIVQMILMVIQHLKNVLQCVLLTTMLIPETTPKCVCKCVQRDGMQMIIPKSVLKNVLKRIKHMERMKQINVYKFVLMVNTHKMTHECVCMNVRKVPSPTIMFGFV